MQRGDLLCWLSNSSIYEGSSLGDLEDSGLHAEVEYEDRLFWSMRREILGFVRISRSRPSVPIANQVLYFKVCMLDSLTRKYNYSSDWYIFPRS